MTSSTTVKTFKYNTTQQPILSVIETPLKYKSFPNTNNNNNNNQIIDLSFSSYLKQEKSEPLAGDHDSEINVFDAQKYFSECNDQKETPKNVGDPAVDSISRLSSSVDGGYNSNFRIRSFHATPTASSEASWNSQTGLLSNPPGSFPVKLRKPSADHPKKKSGSSTLKWFFCRKCPCSGKKSVQVDETTENRIIKANSHNKTHIQRTEETVMVSDPENLQPENHLILQENAVLQHRILPPKRSFIENAGPVGGFSFPILNNSSQTAAKPSTNNNPLIEEPGRESLEVFQPPDSSSMIRKSMEEDVCSEASSDLFEIESFSAQTTTTTSNYPIYRRRDSLEDTPRMIGGARSSLDEPMTPKTECYAPSEVSIDWSVTTAEGFDKSCGTNLSEIEELASFRRRSSIEEECWTSNYSINGKKKLGNGLLLSCRHEKAVNVGPHPARAGPPLPLISSSGHVSNAGRPPKPSVPPPSVRSRSARLSIAFAA